MLLEAQRIKIKSRKHIFWLVAVFCLAGTFNLVQADPAHNGLANTDKAELIELSNKAKAAYASANYAEAESLWTETLSQAEKTDELSVVDCLCHLAKVKDKQEQYAESDRLYELAMRNLERHTKNQDNYLYADYLPDLADLYCRHGKTDKAELIYKKLLDIRNNKSPASESNQNKESEIVKAEERYARFLHDNNRSNEATQHENTAAGIRYKFQLP